MARNRFNYVGVGAIALGHFLVDLYHNALPPLLPLIAVRLDLSLAMCGLAVSLSTVTASLCQPLFGYLTDRQTISNRFMILCVLWMGLPMSYIYWADGFWPLVILAVIAGFGNSLYHPLGSVATASLVGKKRGLGIAIYSTGGNLGYTLMPLFIIPVVTMTQFPTAYLFLAAPAVLGAVIMFAARVHTIKPLTRKVPQPPGAIWKFLRERAGRNLLYLTGVVAMRSWAIYSLIVFVPHLYSHLGYSDLLIGTILTSFLIAGTITGMFGGIISDRWGRLPTIAVSTGLGGLLLAVGVLDSGLIGIALLVAGSGVMQSAFPVAIAFAQELSPENAAMSSGIMMGFSWGLGAVGASVTGLISDWIGIIPGLFFVSIIMVPVAVGVWKWKPDKAVQKAVG